MSTPTNSAAYVATARAHPLTIQPSPHYTPGPGQLLIRNAAVAINPIDVLLQATDFPKLSYPHILGEDVAGEVVEIGDGVQGFETGMRVLSHPKGWPTRDNAQSAFQAYTLVPATLTARIPDDLPFEKAVVLPLGMCTAAAGLYQKDLLALDQPTLTTMPGSKGEVVVVWGGSSSVGGSAVQLLKCSGYEVFATASQRNLSYVESLGATKVFDHSDGDVVDKIQQALEGKSLVGCYDAISTPSTIASMVRIAAQGRGKKMVAITNPNLAAPTEVGVTIKGISAGMIASNNIGPAIFNEFLPQALATGAILAKPDPIVIGKGLDKVQKGIDTLKAGVTAAKVVVTL